MAKMSPKVDINEDIEVVGPGHLLCQAREKAGLTQEQVAEKLNFRLTLVKEIESDQFDHSLPETFNRGYLKNYAKLVNVSSEDVLASFETLNVAKQQGAEMQSFSRQTEKQAENNRLMWATYLILAGLVASTIIWWVQTSDSSVQSAASVESNTTETVEQQPEIEQDNASTQEASSEVDKPSEETPTEQAVVTELISQDTVESQTAQSNQVMNDAVEQTSSTNEQLLAVEKENEFVSLEFTFSGDCWVNIYDATGERLAWGIKKGGYVMTISGKAPFKVTLGKPELVSLKYQENTVDLSKFSRGNIAKFELPLTE